MSDLRETLRNPTDEQVDVLAQVAVQARAAAYAPTNQTVVESPVHLMVRAVLAALAGDDQPPDNPVAEGGPIVLGDDQ